MTDLNSLLREYAIESGELVVPEVISSGDALAEVLNDELEVAREPGLAQKLEHADKAEAIAEQLDVLADRAESQAAEDITEVNAAVAQVSAESLHREFGAIMVANNLELKAASFESATDTKSQLVGLAKDARATSAVVTGFSDQIRDLSTEGAVMQFLRQDKARLAKAHTALAAAGSELDAKKGELSKAPVAITHDGMKRFLVVNGVQVTNVKQAIDHDIQWLKKAEAAVNKLAAGIGAALASAHGEGDHSAVVTKLNALAADAAAGLEAHLLGNHEVTAGKRGGGEKGSAVALGASYVVQSLKNAPTFVGLVVGGAAVGAVAGVAAGGVVGGIAGGLGGVGLGVGAAAKNIAKKTGDDYKKKMDGSDTKSCAGTNDLQSIVKGLLGLSGTTDFSMDQKVEEAGEKLEGASADVKAAGKKALSTCSKLADLVYEHAVYLTVKSAQLVSAAAKSA